MDSERLEQLENAEEELRRRRERGRLAQRAFRKRHENKASRVKHNETERLKAAMKKIVRVARLGDRPELLQVIREAAEVAEVTELDDEPDVQKSTIESNGKVEVQKSITEPLLSLPITRDLVPMSGTQPAGSMSTTQGTSTCNNSWANWRPNDQEVTIFGTMMDLERVTPRLDYGLWFDTCRFVRIDNPPSDIVPYLGNGMTTFAGRLFWSSGEHLLDLCRKAESYAEKNPQAAGEANEKIWSMVQHSTPLHNTRYIRALAEARREYRDRGYIEGNNAAGETDSAKLLNDHVLAEYQARGEDVALRGHLSYTSYQRLERTLQLQDLNQAGDPLARMVQSLIHILAKSYICFGDGPRWRADRVAALLNGSTQNTCVST
ncbi:hypothetical protein F4804DRAFT_351172 [Jackrogersella minutella]|nr:hypothetical protein F4804DRAFT_351172 [Jackrogersella minutella]